jgi:hypothetical protein
MMKPAAAEAAAGPDSMRREARITWSLSILPEDLEGDYLQHDLRSVQCEPAPPAATAHCYRSLAVEAYTSA